MRSLPLHSLHDPRQTPNPSDLRLHRLKHRITLENVGFRFGLLGRGDVGQHSRCPAVVSVSPQTGCSAFYPAGSPNLFRQRRSHTPHTRFTPLRFSQRCVIPVEADLQTCVLRFIMQQLYVRDYRGGNAFTHGSIE